MIDGLRLTTEISPKLIRAKLAKREESSIPKSDFEALDADGWTISAESARRFKVQREKRQDQAFEDRVWAAFASLGFHHLNIDRQVTIPYGKSDGEKHQIDVVAIDDEVILVVECKSAVSLRGETAAFKKDVEAIMGYRPGMLKALMKEYPGRKVKFLLATNNYILSDNTRERIRNAQILHVDENQISYYLQLGEHMGAAGKYQLLGAIFSGQKIPGLDSKIPAIQGKMGSHVYYTFNVHPSRLLKIAYVLHRDVANSQLMPTYQRLIKKPRLKSVAKFVDEGGFFPNSLILNIEKKVSFEPVANQTGPAKLGVLNLPQNYRAAYVIDGQHRLYGFANSARAETELVPVVAFVGMDRKDQVDLFMQINEHQQAVSKTLQNTLNSDLLWDSEDARDRAKALRLRVAQSMEDRVQSPLRGRIVVGEAKTDLLRCVTIESIAQGLDRGGYIGTFFHDDVKEQGLFYRLNNQTTLDHMLPFLDLLFEYFKVELPEQFAIGRGPSGFIFINNGVDGLLRVAADVVRYVKARDGIDASTNPVSDTFSRCVPYLAQIVNYLRTLDPEDARELRRTAGTRGATRFWRLAQAALAAEVDDFKPHGLEEFLRLENKEFNQEVAGALETIESELRVLMRTLLVTGLGESWVKEAVPQSVFKSAGVRASELAWESSADAVDWWDCLEMEDLLKILRGSQKVWDTCFESALAALSGKGKSLKQKTSWLEVLVGVRVAITKGENATEQMRDEVLALRAAVVQMQSAEKAEVVDPSFA